MTDRPTASTITDAQLDELYARLDALERALGQTAADALAHGGCHRKLMTQCQRAERAEAAIARVRKLAELTRDHTTPTHDDTALAQHELARAILDLLEPKEPTP